MFVKTASPVIALSGTTKDCDIVYSTIAGRIQARGRVNPRQPNSADQQLIQNYMSIATKNWDELTQVQRDAWEAYAAAYFTKNAKGEDILPSGITTYAKANVIRQVLGLALTTEAPLEAPPAPITSIAQAALSNPDELIVTLNHAYGAVAGYQVLVRQTPAMLTVARDPREGQHRYVRGVSPNSAAALPATGLDVSFTPTRFEVQDGQRYGVEVRVVRTADGIMSRPVYGDFLKVV